MSFVSLSPCPLSGGKGVRYERNVALHFFSSRCVSQPRLAALGSPFQGKGLAWTLPPSYGRGGMKESEEMHLKSTIYESTLSTAGAVPLPQGGRLRGATLYVDF